MRNILITQGEKKQLYLDLDYFIPGGNLLESKLSERPFEFRQKFYKLIEDGWMHDFINTFVYICEYSPDIVSYKNEKEYEDCFNILLACGYIERI